MHPLSVHLPLGPTEGRRFAPVNTAVLSHTQADRTPRNPPRHEGAKTRSCLLPVTSSLWQSNIRGNWVEAPLEGETGALNESHMFPKMEALQAAWACSAGRSGAPRAALRHSSPTHGCAPSTRFHLAPPWRHEAPFTFAAERESARTKQNDSK